MRKPYILAVDDDIRFLDAVELVLQNEYEVTKVTSGNEALKQFDYQRFNTVLLDINLPGMDGFQLLDILQKRFPHLPVIMLTAETERDKTINAIKKGAYYYLVKPLDRNVLLAQVRNAVKRESMERDCVQLREEHLERCRMIGSSSELKKIAGTVRKVAHTDVSVLIIGETGTGKDMIAQQIHYMGERAGRRFVKINIPGVSEELLESELFGHEKGAFTGAHDRKLGLLEVADGGTVFIDEIGLAAPRVQAKLLQVLDDKKFLRVGGTTPISTDIRIISATSKDIPHEIIEGRFMLDLYHRIRGMEIPVPPLRERKEDITDLIDHYKPLRASELGVRDLAISQQAKMLLLNYEWPGNVRELKSSIDRLLLLCETDEITENDVTSILNPSRSSERAQKPVNLLDKELVRKKREVIESALLACDYNISKVADFLDVSRNTVYRWIKELEINVHTV